MITKCKVTWQEGELENRVEYIVGYEDKTVQNIQQIPNTFIHSSYPDTNRKAEVLRVELLEF